MTRFLVNFQVNLGGRWIYAGACFGLKILCFQIDPIFGGFYMSSNFNRLFRQIYRLRWKKLNVLRVLSFLLSYGLLGHVLVWTWTK